MEDGRTATLKNPYKGYRNIQLIKKAGYKWLVLYIRDGI